MYLLNILITIGFSFVNIIGSIVIGKVPKGSIWQLMVSDLEFIDADYWYNEDVSYQWFSNDETTKALHNKFLDDCVDKLCHSKEMQGEEYTRLSEKEIEILSKRIKTLVKDYNRVIL